MIGPVLDLKKLDTVHEVETYYGPGRSQFFVQTKVKVGLPPPTFQN